VAGGVQTPHPPWIRLPQPSPAGPHAMFCAAHVSGTHVFIPPHWPATPPPPHVVGVGQEPQLAITFPQPSPAGPQSIICSLHVRGTHVLPGGEPQTPGVPLPPHV